MNINKKSLISNTALFIMIMIFAQIFNHFFSAENSITGIMILTSSLMLLQRDLTTDQVKNFFFILAVNLAIGILGYVAQMNIWVAIPVNFIALFGIAYLFSSNLKSPVTLPFGLPYLLTLFDPVKGETFTLRMGALAFGAVLVMLLQFVANKGKLKKTFSKSLISIIDNFTLQVDKNEQLYGDTAEKINGYKC